MVTTAAKKNIHERSIGHEIAKRHPKCCIEGFVQKVSPTGVTISDRSGAFPIGARVDVEMENGFLTAEVCRVEEDCVVALPFGQVAGIHRGARVVEKRGGLTVSPCEAWRGRVLDGFGRPIDGKGALPHGRSAVSLRASPPPAAMRGRLGKRVDFGIKAMTTFTPAREGQRIGLFAGSGIGKSSLLSMIARNTECDVAVIALIGERGREVREFIEDSLGPEGLARSIVIVATSDEPALVRREAAFTAASIAEYFRDTGAHVLYLMDSISRVAAAQREIGLAAGEPPTTRGYTPSVFSLLPSILERAGPGLDQGDGKFGSITGVYSVLVEGDDHEEPIADAARSILDGHIVLNRRIAEYGRFPAIDILKSISRVDPKFPEDIMDILQRVKELASVYDDMREMIRIGAYTTGANAKVDEALEIHPQIEQFLTQSVAQRISEDEAIDGLRAIVR